MSVSKLTSFFIEDVKLSQSDQNSNFKMIEKVQNRFNIIEKNLIFSLIKRSKLGVTKEPVYYSPRAMVQLMMFIPHKWKTA